MIIVGLGNVGKEYENTHHNAGFLALDSIAKANQLEFRLEKKFQALSLIHISEPTRPY